MRLGGGYVIPSSRWKSGEGGQNIYFSYLWATTLRNLHTAGGGLKLTNMFNKGSLIFLSHRGSLNPVCLLCSVPPSPPVCTMTGNPVVNGNVTLSCKSSHGKPVPQYKWTKAAPTSEVFFSPMQSKCYLST